MAHDISLFSGYSQKENRTTNYCLLVLRMLYEENPKLLNEALDVLTDGRTAGHVGVRFRQQQRLAASVPDGVIVQAPFALYVETKNFDWFYDAQIENHLAGLDQEPGLKVLLALANFETTDRRFERIERLCREMYEDRIAFAAVTFEDFLAAVERPGLSKNLADAVRDFRAYLDQEGLLPVWRRLLDVCNCAGKPDDVLVHNVYMCPAEGGAYRHSRCRYFGMYAHKRVSRVAEIEAVVDIQPGPDMEAELLWANVDMPAAELIQRAREKKSTVRPHADYPVRVFVLGPAAETDFRKDTSGGMMGSKQYFDVGPLPASGAESLARELGDLTWSELQRMT
jgi:hypothetical protein